MSKIFAGVLVAAAALAGIYAIAATIATNMAASFPAAKATGRTGIVEFAAAAKLTAAEPGTTRIKCQFPTRATVDACDAEATTQQARARTAARVGHDGGIKPLAKAGMNVPKIAREIDVALYRAHRQFPD